MKVFGLGAVGNIYSANFTVKFPLCRKREMGLVVLRPTCPLSPLYAPRPDFLSDLSSHSRPLFRHYLTWTSTPVPNLFLVLYISSFPLLERAICHSRYPLREHSFSRFSIANSSPRKLVLSLVSLYRNDLYITLYLYRYPSQVDFLSTVSLLGYT